MNLAKDYSFLTILDKDDVVTILFNRPRYKNAFHHGLILELMNVFTMIQSHSCRLVVLRGVDGFFCAGADLNWMKSALSLSDAENLKESQDLFDCFFLIKQCSKPVLGVCEGGALGGAIGFLSVCDYVLCESDSVFSLSEVKLGLIPAIIGPFVLSKIGRSFTHALFLSAKRFDANYAYHIGLVHDVVFEKDLEEELYLLTQQFLLCSPHALSIAKHFVDSLNGLDFLSQGRLAVQTLATIRCHRDAQEGMNAFLEKRHPHWETECE